MLLLIKTDKCAAIELHAIVAADDFKYNGNLFQLKCSQKGARLGTLPLFVLYLFISIACERLFSSVLSNFFDPAGRKT